MSFFVATRHSPRAQKLLAPEVAPSAFCRGIEMKGKFVHFGFVSQSIVVARLLSSAFYTRVVLYPASMVSYAVLSSRYVYGCSFGLAGRTRGNQSAFIDNEVGFLSVKRNFAANQIAGKACFATRHHRKLEMSLSVSHFHNSPSQLCSLLFHVHLSIVAMSRATNTHRTHRRRPSYQQRGTFLSSLPSVASLN